MTDPEIKRLLGKAIGEEPPLRIDRDEVFRAGRKRLRTRRLLEAGGVVAAVVVAAVGAVTLTSLVDESTEPLPPGASSTEHPAPPGPTLPLTTTDTQPPPPSSAPPSTSLTIIPANPDRAAKLTDVFYSYLRQHPAELASDKLSSFHGQPTPPRFKAEGNAYLLEADVWAEQEGSLWLSVSAITPDLASGCKTLPQPAYDCNVSDVNGVRVVTALWKDRKTGEKRYFAHAVRPDGAVVTAVASNMSERERKSGVVPTTPPVLDRTTLTHLATMPGLTFY